MRHLLLSLFVCCIPLSLTAQDTPKQKPPTASVTDAADVEAFFDGVERELRAVMLLTGSRDVSALRRAPRVIVGELERWIAQLR